jgi:CzcA family heavy metal efflux pump
MSDTPHGKPHSSESRPESPSEKFHEEVLEGQDVPPEELPADRPEVAALLAVEHWTAHHTKPILFAIIAIVAIGVYLAFSTPVSVFPEIDFPRIVIGVDNGVMPIDQMLVTVTRPIEEAVNTVQGLDTVRSITSRGSAEVNLNFSWDVDMFQTLERVNAALARAQPLLPASAKVTANRLTFAAFPIIGYSLTSDVVSQTRLWEIANYEMKPRLNRLDGVSTVIVQGGQEPEFEIRPNPAKMLEAGVSVPAILDALKKTNLIDSPGLIEANHQLVLGLVSGQARTLGDIAQIVVKTTPAGLPVQIQDVAAVTNSVKPVYTIVTSNGKPAVLLNINRQPDSNTVSVANAVHDEIEQIRKTLPNGVALTPFYDQSQIVNDSIRSVRDAILIGLLLAGVVVILFLRDWRTSVVAGLVIPATMAISIILLHLFGQSFNLMTLGGLAAAVGLVIDDAIVVVENIALYREAGKSRSAAIQSALREIAKPLIGSTITPIVVFLPLVSITGVTGEFFRALAITVAGALLTSLVLALTWTPALSHYFLRSKPRHVDPNRKSMLDRVIVGYQATLRFAMEHPKSLLLVAVAVVAGAYYSYDALGSDLLPAMDEGGFIVDYLTPAGTSLTETNRIVSQIEQIIRESPEVETTSRRTGMQLGLAQVTEANYGDFTVMLKRDRERNVEDVISEIRAKVRKRLPVVDVEFPQLLQDMIGDLTSVPEPVEIKLFSQRPELLREWAPRVGDEIRKVRGVVDVLDGIENTISGPAVTFRIDPSGTARAGFSPDEIQQAVSAIIQGEPSDTPVVMNDRPMTIRVRYPEASRATIETIRNTLLVSGSGKTATLGSLANVQELPGQLQIRRENLQRYVAVTARLEGVDLGAGIRQVQAAVQKLNLPPAIRVVYGGTYREQQKSFRDLLLVLALAVVLVFAVLLFEFRSFSAPSAIMVSALLSTSGVFLALLITGISFNISSFMGLIMVIGIVAKNGILLLDAEERYRAQGFCPVDAMLEAGKRRLRPILMTAIATIVGMFPLALALGAGSQMLQPLAIAVIGGVLASIILSLVITPVVHYYMAYVKLR